MFAEGLREIVFADKVRGRGFGGVARGSVCEGGNGDCVRGGGGGVRGGGGVVRKWGEPEITHSSLVTVTTIGKAGVCEGELVRAEDPTTIGKAGVCEGELVRAEDPVGPFSAAILLPELDGFPRFVPLSM